MKNKKVMIGIFLGAAIIGLSVYALVFRNQGAGEIKVSVDKADNEVVSSSIYTNGKVVSKNTRNVSSSLMSKVLAVKVKVGSKVVKGQTLAVQDTGDLRASLDQQLVGLRTDLVTLEDLENGGRQKYGLQLKSAKLTLDSAKSTYVMKKELYSQGLISAVEVDGAKLAYDRSNNDYVQVKRNYDGSANSYQIKLQRLKIESANMTIAKLRSDINKGLIKSPITGTVTDVNIKVGDSGAQGPMFVVQDLSSLQVETGISEYDINKIKVGQTAEIKVEGSAISYGGKIKTIYPAGTTQISGANSETVVNTLVSLTGKSETIRPNFNVKLTIFTSSSKKVLAVPIEAILEREDMSKVAFVVDSLGKVAETQVTIGKTGDTHVEILKGLKLGDVVVINPPETLKNGDLVKATQEK